MRRRGPNAHWCESAAIRLAALALLVLHGAASCEPTPKEEARVVGLPDGAARYEATTTLPKKRHTTPLDSLWQIADDSASVLSFTQSQRLRAQLLADQGKLGESLDVLDQLVDRLMELQQHKELAQLRNRMGELLGMLGDYSRSVQHLHRAYDLALQAGDTAQMLIANNIIAKHCAAIGNYDLAHDYLKRSLAMMGTDTVSDAGAQVYHILGEICMGYGNPERAEQFLHTAFSIAHRLGNAHVLAGIMQDLARAQIVLGKSTEAKQTIRNMALILDRDTGYMNCLYLHWVTGRYERAFGRAEAARVAYDSAYEAAMHIGNPALQVELLEDLAQLARDVGNDRQAYELLVRAQDMQDSLKDFLSSKRFTLADLQTAQQLKLSEMQRADALQEDAYSYTLRRQRITLYGAIIFFVWVLFVLFFIRQIYRKRLRLHEELVDRKRQIDVKHDELIRLTNHLVMARSKAITQWNRIEHTRQEAQLQNDLLMSSIDHASSIQRAIFPVTETLKHWLPEHFILVRPRDLVCSVLPWVGRLGQDTMVLALVDCQGRSAAGASLTFIVYMLLYEIVIDNDELDPAMIVQKLNEWLAHLIAGADDALKKELQIKVGVLAVHVRDCWAEFVGLGMDLYYAGTREGVSRIEAENDAIDLKGKTLRLVSHRLDYTPSTVFYLTSDGYLNQKDIKGVRMGQHRFRQILNAVQGLPLEQQAQELLIQHMKYRLGVEQTEDIVVGGFIPPTVSGEDTFLGK